MATPTITNTYVGDGSTVLYSFTFPYIDIRDVNVQIDSVLTTEYIFANATTIQLAVAPVDGAEIVIFRSTDSSDLKAVFFPGSAIRARDLNDNFTQSLYVVQEATFNVSTAEDDADRAIAIAEEANAKATAAADDASSADASATQALSAAQDAQSQATQAGLDASAAQSAAATAASEATQAGTDASEAQVAAAAAQQAAQDAADAVAEGGVASVAGKTGVVSLVISDLTDVDTTSTNHVPTDGQALVWNQSMDHWMPSDLPDASLDIGSLPTLP